MGYSRYIGRVGALAVALGVGVAVASTPGVAWADDTTTAGGSSAPADAAPPKPDSDNHLPSNDNPDGDTGDDADNPATTNTTTTGSQTTTTIGGHGSPQVTISGSTVNTSNNDGDIEETDKAAADQKDTTGVRATPTAGFDPAPAATLTVKPAPSTPPPAAPGKTPPPSGPAPQGNSGQAPAGTVNTVATSRVGQSTAASFDTKQRSLAPRASSPSPSRLINQDAAGLAATGQHLIAASGAQSARTTALASSPQDPVQQPTTVASVAKTVVAALLSPFMAPGPKAPVESPVLWAMLGWIRRETQRTTVTPPSTVTPQETTLVVDPVDQPMALMAAAAPTAAAPTAALGRRNVAPIALPDFYTTTEDTARTVTGRGVLGNDFDLNGDPLSAALVAAPKNGTVTLNPTGSFTYTPKANYSGLDSFTYRASDGTTTSNVATVLVNVTAVNDPPVATADTYSTAKGVKLTVAAAAGVLKNDVDPDSKTLTAQLVYRPSNGTLTFNTNGSFTYTPRTNFSGTDTFTYRASDGIKTSAPTTVSITVGNPNTAPVANNDAYSTNEDNPLTITGPGVLSNDTDAQANPLTAVLVSQPTKGSVTLNTNGSFTYTPNSNVNGADSFTYKASDGTTTSNTATVSITVNPANDPPTAVGDGPFTVAEDNSRTFTAAELVGNDTDPDAGDVLHVASVGGATNGNAVLNDNGTVTYTSTPNYSGPAQFSYTVADAANTPSANTATVTITVTEVDDAPTAVNDSASTNEGTAVTIPAPGLLANDSDVEGSALTAVLVTPSAHGMVTVNPNGSFTYTPAVDYNGPDSFTYKANDGALDGNTATVHITVNPVNDSPVANASAGTPDAQTGEVTVTLVTTDAEGDPLTITAPDPASGNLTLMSSTLNSDGTATRTYSYAPDGQARLAAYTSPTDPDTEQLIFRISDGLHTQPTTASTTVEVSPAAAAVTANVALRGNAVGSGVVGPDGTIYQTIIFGTSSGVATGVSVIDPADPENPTTIELPGFPTAPGLVVGPDGTIYQTSYTESETGTLTHVSVIDPADPEDPTTIDLPGAPPQDFEREGVVVGPDGTAYQTTVTGTGTGTVTHVSVIDPADPDHPITIDLPGAPPELFRRVGVIVGHDGTAYQTTFTGSGTGTVTHVSLIDPADPDHPTTIDLPGYPTAGVILGPDATVYQTTTTRPGFQDVTHVSVIDPADPDHPTTIDVPGFPFVGGVVVGPDGTVYQTTTTGTSSGDVTHVSVIDPADPDHPTTIDLPGFPSGGVVVGPDGTIHQTSRITTFGTNSVTFGTHVTMIDPADPDHPTTAELPGQPFDPLVVGPDGTVYLTSFTFADPLITDTGRVTHVSVIDPADADHPTTIDLPGQPFASIVVGPDGTIYQTSGTHTTNGWVTHLSVIDPADPDHPTTIDLPGLPEAVVVGPDGTAYQAVGGTVWVISVAQRPAQPGHASVVVAD